MVKTFEVEVDSAGEIHLLHPEISLPQGRALLVTGSPAEDNLTRMSEAALAEDWLTPEEDAAWAYLQPEK